MKAGRSALALYPLALLLGVGCALLVAGFDLLIHLVHNLAFAGRLSLRYDLTLPTAPAPWGLATALVPAAGALLVTTLARKVSPEVEGPGVAQVLEAAAGRRRPLPPLLLGLKPLASALSIGTGASVGREGPAVHMSAALGGLLGRLPGLQPWQRNTLLAAAASGAVAAAYNAPLGGALFAVEIVLAELSVRTVVPVLLCSVSAAYLGRLLLGTRAILAGLPFPGTPHGLQGAAALLPYLLLGPLAGLVSVAFIRMPFLAADLLHRLIRRNPWLRHGLAMLLTGALIVAVFRLTGRYRVEGLGYATIREVLSAELDGALLLLLLAALKLLLTALALGAGASGGVLTPALYVGATLGGAVAHLLGRLAPWLPQSTPALALAGMAAMLASATGAPVMAVLTTLEMTGEIAMAAPLALTVALGYGIRKVFLQDSAYTLRLTRAGRPLPEVRLIRWLSGERPRGKPRGGGEGPAGPA
jgi:CIC family chloride channel protein